MSDEKPLVIYHAGCWDGFCAAWLFHIVFPDAEFVAAQYGNKPPDVTGRDIFVVDFCYTAEQTAEMIRVAKSVVILDHHKTAEAELAKLDGMTFPVGVQVAITFDMEKSGGRLAWEYLCANHQIVDRIGVKGLWSDTPPWLVTYTEDRDLWRHQLPDTKAINAYIRSFPLDFGLWDSWLRGLKSLDRYIAAGEAILRFQEQLVAHHVSKAYEGEVAGHKILAVNATTMASEIAGELAKGRPFGAVYFVQQNQQVWYLRSDENGIDVSEVAKQFGGGGHVHAAGFQCSGWWFHKDR